MFSLGAVFYNLLTGKHLFFGHNNDAVLKANIACDTSHVKRNVATSTHHCRDLINWMLEPSPQDRPTPKQALKHSWFTCDK